MKKKQKARRIIIDDNVFMVKLHIYTDCTNECFEKHIERKHNTVIPKVEGAEGNFLSCETDGGTLYCLWIESFDKTEHKLGVLDHEISHCAYSILTDRGIDINDETEEVLAYYHSYLLTEAYKKLIK